MFQKKPNIGFSGLLDSVAGDTALSADKMMELLLTSTTEALSQESSLPLCLDFQPKEYKMDIYTPRLIKDDPLGFGEISSSDADKMSSAGKGFFGEDSKSFYQFLRSVSFNTDTFFSRHSVAQISQIMKSKILEITKSKEFELFKDREGDLISGVVTRIEAGGHIILNLGLGEGFLSKFEVMPGEFFGIGSTVQAYVYQVEPSSDKYQIKLSRSRPEFLGCLMSSVIPEIESGLIEIKSIARDPGSRSKVAVYSNDPSIDPIGPCIGRDGIRIKSVRSLVANERIDIVKWDPDIAVFIANALGVDVSKFILHDDNLVEIVCSEEVLDNIRSGKKQRIRLISRLTKRRIKLTSAEEDKLRVEKEKIKSIAMLQKLGFNDSDSLILFKADLKTPEDIMDSEDDFLQSILSMTENKIKVEELRDKAYSIYKSSILDDYIQTGIDVKLIEVPYAFAIEPVFYQSRNILTKNDLAELDSDEVREIFIDFLSADPEVSQLQAEEIVIWSRKEGD